MNFSNAEELEIDIVIRNISIRNREIYIQNLMVKEQEMQLK